MKDLNIQNFDAEKLREIGLGMKAALHVSQPRTKNLRVALCPPDTYEWWHDQDELARAE